LTLRLIPLRLIDHLGPHEAMQLRLCGWIFLEVEVGTGISSNSSNDGSDAEVLVEFSVVPFKVYAMITPSLPSFSDAEVLVDFAVVLKVLSTFLYSLHIIMSKFPILALKVPSFLHP